MLRANAGGVTYLGMSKNIPFSDGSQEPFQNGDHGATLCQRYLTCNFVTCTLAYVSLLT